MPCTRESTHLAVLSNELNSFEMDRTEESNSPPTSMVAHDFDKNTPSLDSISTLPSPASLTPSIPPAAIPSESSDATTPAVLDTTGLKTNTGTYWIIIICAAVGGSIALLAVLFFAVCYIRRSKHRTVHIIEPYTESAFPVICTVNSPSSKHSTYTAASPCIARLSFQGGAPSLVGSLSTEIFPLPSEVEDVYQQLEALTTEVDSLYVREKAAQAGLNGASFTRSERMQAGIAALRTEVDRLKRYSMNTNTGRCNDESPSGAAVSRSIPMDMLRELAILRAEIEEMLMQQMGSVTPTMERLPSYSSGHATLRGPCTRRETPPPLPTVPPPRNTGSS